MMLGLISACVFGSQEWNHFENLFSSNRQMFDCAFVVVDIG